MERLSVIIPAHNAGAYLQQAVESVRAQQWAGEMEILVVDDGSTDHTEQMALTLGVTLLQKQQGGAASARNMGLRAASGSLVLLLDADDVLSEGALEALAAPLQAGEADVVFGMAEDFVSPELTPERQAQLRPRDGAYGGVLPGCSLIRRSVFETVGLFDDTMTSGETVAWLMALRDHSVKTVQLPVVTLRRRLHLTNTGRLRKAQEMAAYAALLRRRMKERK